MSIDGYSPWSWTACLYTFIVITPFPKCKLPSHFMTPWSRRVIMLLIQLQKLALIFSYVDIWEPKLTNEHCIAIASEHCKVFLFMLLSTSYTIKLKLVLLSIYFWSRVSFLLIYCWIVVCSLEEFSLEMRSIYHHVYSKCLMTWGLLYILKRRVFVLKEYRTWTCNKLVYINKVSQRHLVFIP